MSRSDIDLLICQLRDGREETRAEAARSLAEHPSPLAKKDLMRCLGDSSDQVRYWATAAVARLEDRTLMAALTNQLEDPAASVRLVAARALSESSFRGAVQPLLKALGDDNENVREWASRALARMGDSVSPALVSTFAGPSWKRRRMAAKTLLRIGRGAYPALKKGLRRPDRNVRFWSLQVIGELKIVEAAPLVSPFLEVDDPVLLASAIRVSAQLGDREAVPRFLNLLGHPEENVRLAAVEGLATFGDYSVKQLADLLNSSKRSLRLSASASLAAAGDTSLSAILEKFKEESLELRFWSIRALERFDNPAIVPILVDLLDDDEPDVQLAAARALGNFDLEAPLAAELVPKLSVEDWRVRKALAEAMARADHLPLHVFEAGLKSPSEDVRFWTTKILASFPYPKTVELLMQRFEDPVWPIRKRAAESIAALGSVAAPVVLEALRSEPGDVNRRYWLTRALVGIQDERIVPVLVELLADRDPSMRGNAQEALAAMGDTALKALLDALHSSQSRVHREAVARTLIALDTPQIELLIAMFQFRDPEVNHWISYTLGHMGPRVMPELSRLVIHGSEMERNNAFAALLHLPSEETFQHCMEALEDEFPSIRRQAIGILGRYRVASAREPLIQCLDSADEEDLSTLISALGRIGGEGVREALEPLLSHPRWEIRQAVIRALGELGSVDVLQPLAALLEKENAEDLRPQVLEALASLALPEVGPLAAPYLQSEDRETRIRAIQAVGASGDGKQAAGLRPLLDSDDWEVIHAALDALGRLGTPEDVAALKPLLSGDDLVLRGQAQRTLKALLGPDRWRELTSVTIKKQLDDPAEEAFQKAQECIAQQDRTQAIKHLRKAARLRKKPDHFALMGTLFMEEKQLDRAVKAFEKVLRLSPKDVVATSKLAICHILRKDHSKAIPLLKKAAGLPGCPPDMASFCRRTLRKLLSS